MINRIALIEMAPFVASGEIDGEQLMRKLELGQDDREFFTDQVRFELARLTLQFPARSLT